MNLLAVLGKAKGFSLCFRARELIQFRNNCRNIAALQQERKEARVVADFAFLLFICLFVFFACVLFLSFSECCIDSKGKRRDLFALIFFSYLFICLFVCFRFDAEVIKWYECIVHVSVCVNMRTYVHTCTRNRGGRRNKQE